MRAKLILDSGEEIEIELTEEQEKAIRNDSFPKMGDMYYTIGTFGRIDRFEYTNTCYDKGAISIGNYYKTEQEAEDTVRALKLIESIRKDRERLNGDWIPDWTNDNQDKWDINYVESYNFVSYISRITQDTNLLGWYKSEEAALQIINKYRSELVWLFEDFLPR